MFYWMAMRRQISETPLSQALSGEAESFTEPQWRLTGSFGPYVRHSPHYSYHSASNQVRVLTSIWEEEQMDHARRVETAQGLIDAWTSGTTDSEGDRYIQSVWEQATRPNKSE